MRCTGQKNDIRAGESQTGAPPDHAHRKFGFRLALIVSIIVIAITWLAKGTGIKSWMLGKLHPTPPVNLHNDTIEVLSNKVRLDSDPLVHFERVQLPITAGTAFTCLRIGPDGMLYASSIDGLLFRYT